MNFQMTIHPVFSFKKQKYQLLVNKQNDDGSYSITREIFDSEVAAVIYAREKCQELEDQYE